MVRYELQRLPGAPLQRGTVDAGTTLMSLLDSLQLHRDVIVKLNGRALPDDYDISRPLQSGDVVAVFDQPEGGVGKLVTTILRPVTKILSGALKVFGLSNKPSASVSVATGESPNNDLTGQTNRARLYKGRPNIYGQCRVFPDLIQEALFEFVDNNKQLTEWFEVGYGRYTISSIRYSESNLGSLAGASSAIYNPGDVIGTIEVGYQFDDVDNETVPGLNESQDFPAQTATTTAPTSVAIESNQLKAVVLSNDDNFAYFAALAVPHPVSFVINATGTTVAQASHGMSPAPGISSPRRALSATIRFRTRRSILANYREKLRLCRAMRLSTRLCSRLMTRRRWLSVRQCRQLSRLKCGCMCWSSSVRRPAQRNTGSSSGRSMTTTIRCLARQSSMIISSITTSR